MSGIRTYIQTDMRVAPTQDNHLVRLRDMIEYVNALTTEAVRVVLTENFDGTYDSVTQAFVGIAGSATIDIDGVDTWNDDDRILLAGQLDKTQNGIYIVTGTIGGVLALERADNFNSVTTIINGLIVPVLEGDVYGMTRWRTVLGGTPFVLDSTNIEFIKEVVDLTRVVEMTFELEGSDTAMEYTITHALGTRHVTHELYNADGDTVVGGFRRLSVNDVRVNFGVPLGEDNDLTLVLRAEVDPT